MRGMLSVLSMLDTIKDHDASALKSENDLERRIVFSVWDESHKEYK